MTVATTPSLEGIINSSVLVIPLNDCVGRITEFYPKMPSLEELSVGVNGNYPDWLKGKGFIKKLRDFFDNSGELVAVQQELLGYLNFIERKVSAWDYCNDNGCDNFKNFKKLDGKVFCGDCGLELREDFSEHGRRAFTAEEISKRKQNEPCWGDIGPRTVVPNDGKDAKGKLLSSSQKSLFYRLNKVQRRSVSNLERNYRKAKQSFKRVNMYFDDLIIDLSWKIYAMSVEKKLVAGRSIEQFVATSIYAAVRVSAKPRLLSDIARDLEVISPNVKGKPLERLIRNNMSVMLKKGVFKDLGIVIKHLKVADYAPTYCSKVGMSAYLTTEVVKLIDYLAESKHPVQDDRGEWVKYNIQGKNPGGIIAAAMYTVLKKEQSKSELKRIVVEMGKRAPNFIFKGNYYMTQALGAKYMGVTKVTVRNHFKEIKKAIKHLVEI